MLCFVRWSVFGWDVFLQLSGLEPIVAWWPPSLGTVDGIMPCWAAARWMHAQQLEQGQATPQAPPSPTCHSRGEARVSLNALTNWHFGTNTIFAFSTGVRGGR